MGTSSDLDDAAKMRNAARRLEATICPKANVATNRHRLHTFVKLKPTCIYCGAARPSHWT